jgi:hypothetical protein
MTTISFVAGMLPLVTSKGIGSSFNRATAGLVVGGQTLSLLLTLLVTPVAYSLLDDVSAWFKRKVLSGRTPEETGEAEVLTLDSPHGPHAVPTPAHAASSGAKH